MVYIIDDEGIINSSGMSAFLEESSHGEFPINNNNLTMNKYNFWHSLLKTVLKFGIGLLPTLMVILPAEWMNITVGGVIYMFLDYVQKTYTNA